MGLSHATVRWLHLHGRPRCKHRGDVCKAIRACSPISPMGLPPATVRWLHWHRRPKEFPDEKVLLGRYALGLRKKNRRRLPRCKHRGVVCKAIRACSPMSPMGLPPATVRWLHWHGSPRCFHSNTSPLRVFF